MDVNNHFVILASISPVHYQPTVGDTMATYTIHTVAIGAINPAILEIHFMLHMYILKVCYCMSYAIRELGS